MIIVFFIVFLGSVALGVQIFGQGGSAISFGLIVGWIGFYSVIRLIESGKKK